MIRPFRYSDLKIFETLSLNIKEQIFVFEDKRQIKGAISISENKINFISVLSKYKRLGIGSKLLEYVRRNKSCMMLNIKAEDIEILRFSQHKGFKIINVSADNILTLAWSKGCINITRPRGSS